MCEEAWSAFKIVEEFVDKFPDFLMKLLWHSGILTKAGHVPSVFFKLKFSFNFQKVLIYFSSFLCTAFFLSAIFYHSLHFGRQAELFWIYICLQKLPCVELEKLLNWVLSMYPEEKKIKVLAHSCSLVWNLKVISARV